MAQFLWHLWAACPLPLVLCHRCSCEGAISHSGKNIVFAGAPMSPWAMGHGPYGVRGVGSLSTGSPRGRPYHLIGQMWAACPLPRGGMAGLMYSQAMVSMPARTLHAFVSTPLPTSPHTLHWVPTIAWEHGGPSQVMGWMDGKVRSRNICNIVCLGVLGVSSVRKGPLFRDWLIQPSPCEPG